jgi:4a-hydroxytetrahydrobiopterin dehydratase
MPDNRAAAERGTMPRLDDTAVEDGLQRLPSWNGAAARSSKRFVCNSAQATTVFVNEVAVPAEAAGHQPDIDIRWN